MNCSSKDDVELRCLLHGILITESEVISYFVEVNYLSRMIKIRASNFFSEN